MDKIFEALSKMLPEDQVKEVSSAINEMLEASKAELESEYNKNLEMAYEELSKELKDSEKVALEGYEQAMNIINELKNDNVKLKTELQEEYNSSLEEGFEEAYQEILAERQKNEQIELQLHEEYENKYQEMRKFFVEKLHQFLETKGKEIYEMARKDIMSDPSVVEHKLVLDKVVNAVGNYLTDEDKVVASSTKVEEISKKLEEQSTRIRMLEAKNIRLANENTKLNEQVKEAADLITESRTLVLEESRKNRSEKAKNVTGRGEITNGQTKVISEFKTESEKTSSDESETLIESISPEELHQMQVLAGTKVNK